jgi:glutamine amidotransferase
MQLFFESSEEFGFSTGLGLLNGDVKPIQALAGHRVHMGWNNLNVIRESRLISEKDSDLEVYFAHSFSCHPRDEKLVIATSDFGQGVTAIVEFENVMGVQFHPEKSQVLGSRILSRFRDLND